jgi:membrane protease subunit HflC
MSKVLVGVVGLLLLTLWQAMFIIPEGRQAVITQFGKPVRTVTEPGLDFKTPFFQDVKHIDARILSWDGFPNQIPTKDKKYIEVDTTARWKIIDPLKFIQTVQSEQGARSRLDAILDGVTRDVISNNNLVEAVRNSNNIFDTISLRKKELKEKEASGEVISVEEEEITGEVERIEIGREQLSQLIVEAAGKELKDLGISLIDVQLKRISYEDSVEKKVYARMISERERVAQKIRSMGKGERAKIEGKIKKELNTIESEAYRTVQEIKGQAEAKSTRIYAQSLSQDPSFYKFTRSLDVYKRTLSEDSKFLMSSDAKLFEVLFNGK